MRNKPKVYVSPSERMVHGCTRKEYGMSMYNLYKHTTKTQTQYIFFSLLSISFDYVHFRNEYVGKNVLLRNENNFVRLRRDQCTILVPAQNFIARLS